MVYIKLFEQFVNEKLDLNSEEFRAYVIDTVAKKCPWAEVTRETTIKDNNFDGITFDNAVEIYWKEGPENQTNSMIRVESKGRFKKIDPKNPDMLRVGEEISKSTKWNKQDTAVSTLIKTLKSNSPNSPTHN